MPHGAIPDDPFDQPGPPRRLSTGRAFVYVLPCRDDTRFKVGHARDPLQRWLSFDRRFVNRFDLDRGLLLECDRVAVARRIERTLLQQFSDHACPPPVDVDPAAGGANEWLRGALDAVVETALVLAAAAGSVPHRPATTWLRAHLQARLDRVHDWSDALARAIDYARFNGATREASRLIDELRETVATHASVGLDLRARLSAPALRVLELAP